MACRKEVSDRERIKQGSAIGGRTDYIKIRSPFIINSRLEKMNRQILVSRAKNFQLLAAKVLKNDVVEASNIDAKSLFNPNDLKNHYEEMISNSQIKDKEVTRYLFIECTEVGKRINAKGSSQGHRYSGLLIQFACILCAKYSVDMYEFFRKVFNLPANTTLCRYYSSDSTSPDGVMNHEPNNNSHG